VGGNPHRLIRALLGSYIPLQVIVVVGRNGALRRELQRFRPGSNGLKVSGFVDAMAGYLAASEMLVGKGGPASAYEALAVGRPVLITSYTGLNERAVVRFIERQGLGQHLKTPEALLEKVRRYASDPTSLEEIALRCRGLDLETKTERLAHYIVRNARASAYGQGLQRRRNVSSPSS
jgi:UDP-N-acetylglucosamine:LPS N-acetylglucosamine transferase